MTRIVLPAIVLLAAATLVMLQSCGTRATDNTVLLPVADDPTVSFRICFTVGSQQDPAGKEGLALLTATLISEGASTRNTYDQILEKLYPMAASYAGSADKEMTVISGRTHKDNLDAYLALFLDAILHPAFREDDFERVRSDMVNYLEKTLRYSSDEELGKEALYGMIFSGTGYGHPTAGTIDALRHVTVDDVRAFYTAHYTRNNVVIGCGGGYTDAVLDRLRSELGTLPEGAAAAADAAAPPPIEGLQVCIVEKECDATAISFGFPLDLRRGDDDFFALALFNSWFGEHRNSSSHLYQVIREKRGMNYGDYSYIEYFPNAGRYQMPPPNHARHRQLFEVWLRPVQHAHRHFALRAAFRELATVIDSGMRQEDFDLTKRFLVKYALHFATTTSERLGYAIDSRFYGIDGDYIELFRSKIEALTLDQVNAAIRKHLQYRNVAIAMVTSGAAECTRQLLADAPSPVAYSSPKPDAVLQEDQTIAVFPLHVTPGHIRVLPLEQMFQR